MSDLPFSFSGNFCSLIPLSLGVLSCLSTLIILLMYACARLEVLTWRFSSDGPVSILEFLRPFPFVRLSQTVPPEQPLLRPSSIAEFFLFLPANKPPTPPSLRWLPFKLSREGLDRVCGPDSEAERTLSFPFLRLMGKSLNHFAMAVKVLTLLTDLISNKSLVFYPTWTNLEVRAIAPALRTNSLLLRTPRLKRLCYKTVRITKESMWAETTLCCCTALYCLAPGTPWQSDNFWCVLEIIGQRCFVANPAPAVTTIPAAWKVASAERKLGRTGSFSLNPVKIPFPEREMVRPVCRPGEVMRWRGKLVCADSGMSLGLGEGLCGRGGDNQLHN